ncbi:MAG: AraC family transcriptional regulator [Gammaproteobacteria bacterium]
MDSNPHYSALSSWVLLVAKAIDSYGFDSADLFARSGLDYSRLRDPGARFSYAGVTRLWELATQVTRDPCFGLTAANLWHPTTLHALGYSWFASSSLQDAYERLRRYARFISTAANGALRIEKSTQSYCLILDPSRMKLTPATVAIDAGLGMILNMSRAAYGEHFRALRVSLRHDAPGEARHLERFNDLVGAPVAFAQSENALWLDPEMVTEALATANPELTRVGDQVITDYLAQLDRNDVTMRVKSKLIERLPGGKVSEEGIASSINVSQRSLQRKLRQQGMSFTQLLENTRRELSLQYVRDPQYSLHEVSFLLGFAEPGNFSRAFKRWYGQSPSQFRQDSLS